MKSRNIFAVLAGQRRAGSHRKSNKALRKQAKQSRYNESALLYKTASVRVFLYGNVA